MNWSDITGLIGTAAPMVGTLLGGPAGGAVGALVASALGTDAEPEAVAKAIQADPEAAAKLATLQEQNRAQLERMHLEAETARLTQVNQTMRAEYGSADKYVARWRPTFGYMVAATWGLQTLAYCFAVIYSVFDPASGSALLIALADLTGALMPMWAVALSVLGVNVASRSADKKVAAGQTPPPGILGALTSRIAGAGK